MSIDTLEDFKNRNLLLLSAQDAYYKESELLMSDADYDQAEKELRVYVARNPSLYEQATSLHKVGSDLREGDSRIKHKYPMLSLEKATTVDEITSWIDNLPWSEGDSDDLEVIITAEPKVDGLSISNVYVNSKFVSAATRGDGEYGEDVTAAAWRIKEIPKVLPVMINGRCEIRGEAFVTINELNRLNKIAAEKGDKPFANTRNLASGTLKAKDPKVLAERILSFKPWDVIIEETNDGLPETPGAVLDWLHQKMLFRQSLIYKLRNKRAIPAMLENLRKERETMWKVGLGMETDGIVLKVDSYQHRKQAGVASRVPRWAIAFKYPSEEAVTTLNDVIWQIGRTGNVTPVGVLEPVQVSGAMIARVNLNNHTYIQKLDVAIGDSIIVRRAGEVIPFVVGVAEKAQDRKLIGEPVDCPECGAILVGRLDEKSKVLSHFCENEECPAIRIGYLTYISAREILDIDGLGDELAEALVHTGGVYDVRDLAKWVVSSNSVIQSPERKKLFEAQMKKADFPVAMTMTMLSSFPKSFNRPWDRWIAALGIPGVSTTLGKNMAKHFRLGPDSFLELADHFRSLKEKPLDGIGIKKMTAILNWIEDDNHLSMLTELHDLGVRPESLIKEVSGEPSETPLTGINICVTGEFPSIGDREYIHECLESLGATIKGVSKKLHILCAGVGAGPSKLSKAKELGINVVRKDWLDDIFKDNKIKYKPMVDADDDDSDEGTIEDL